MGVLDTEELSSSGASLPDSQDGWGAQLHGQDADISRPLYKMLPLDSTASSNPQKPRYGGLAAPDLLRTLSWVEGGGDRHTKGSEE